MASHIKARTDSLASRLQAAGLFEEFMGYAHAPDTGYAEMTEWLDKAGIGNSHGAIANLLKVHGLPWRVQQAQQAAEALEEIVLKQSPGLEARYREALKQARFDAAFSDLGARELVLLERLELDKARLELESRRLDLDHKKFEAAVAKGEEAKATLEDTTLTDEERHTKLVAIVDSLLGIKK